MQHYMITLISLTIIFVGHLGHCILTNQQTDNSTQISKDSGSNSNNATTIKELKIDSSFYYDSDAYLMNKSKSETKKQSPTEQSANLTTTTLGNHEEEPGEKSSQRQIIKPANSSMISGRNGRMLDLDALVGDIATSRANKERLATGNRQSRYLAPDGQSNLDIGGGKRLHIQGFIPIVGVKDDSDETDQESSASSSASSTMTTHIKQRPKVTQLSNANDLPYAQSSLGHATFGVQRYLNTDQQQQHQQLQQYYPSADHQLYNRPLPQQQQQVDAKYSGGASSVVDTLKRPIKKLANFASSSSSNQNHNYNQQPVSQQNCLCVPFYMCKNGYISENSLGKTQIQQMLAQNQHLQQPRQIDNLPLDIKRGIVESVPATMMSSQMAPQTIPLIDERSMDRDLVTAPPMAIDGQSGEGFFNEIAANMSMSDLTLDLATTSTTTTTTTTSTPSPDHIQMGGDLANSNDSKSYANSSQSDVSASSSSMDQNSDYSQDILGRMLGLKASAANSRYSTSSGTSSSSTSGSTSGGGVCGILRTCCNIPVHLYPSQQDLANEKLMAQYGTSSSRFAQPANQMIAADLVGANQQAVQKYQQLPYGLPMASSQSLVSVASRSQPANQYQHLNEQQYQLANQIQQQQQQQLAHRTSNQYPASVGNRFPTNQVSQFTRAAAPMQSIQSFQQQPQQQLYQTPKINNNNNWPQQINSPMGNLNQPPAPIMKDQFGVASSSLSNSMLGTKKLLEGRCGLRQSAGITGRVQSLQYPDSSADFGEYPAQAAILRRLNGSESLFVCGGTLISQYWIATAAHCIKKHSGSDLKVRLGEWDVHRDDEFYPFVEKEVRDIVIHSEFVPGHLVNDIALLRLDSPVDPSLPHVNPACLPTVDETFARQRCWVTGWGKDSFGQKGSFQAVLREVELPVIGHGECESALRQTRLGPHYRLHSGFICAGGEGGRDACEGDGGSGLYCFQDGTIKVAGLVSWGIGCGQAGVPGVYVNLAHYRPWIENIISIDEDIYSKNSAPVVTTQQPQA